MIFEDFHCLLSRQMWIFRETNNEPVYTVSGSCTGEPIKRDDGATTASRTPVITNYLWLGVDKGKGDKREGGFVLSGCCSVRKQDCTQVKYDYIGGILSRKVEESAIVYFYHYMIETVANDCNSLYSVLF